jgi:hypothetical protein
MLRESRTGTDGARRALRDYVEAAEDAGAAAESAVSEGLGAVEDTVAEVLTTGRIEFGRFVDGIAADLARLAVRQLLLAPAAGFLESQLGSGGGPLAGLFSLFHQGGVVGAPRGPEAYRLASPQVFRHAERLHTGGIAGMGLLPDEVPVIARKGEIVLPPERIRREGDLRPVTVVMNVTTADAASFRASRDQIASDLARALMRAQSRL